MTTQVGCRNLLHERKVYVDLEDSEPSNGDAYEEEYESDLGAVNVAPVPRRGSPPREREPESQGDVEEIERHI